MTHVQLKSKLTKIYNLSVSQCNLNEAEVAKEKLNVLCKKYNLRLKDFIFYSVHDIDFSTSKKDVSTKKSASKDTSTKKRASRRSLIIQHVQKNMFTTATLAKLLCDKHDYKDIKANKKAIAGTLYDMLKQNKFNKVIRHDNDIIEVIV